MDTNDMSTDSLSSQNPTDPLHDMAIDSVYTHTQTERTARLLRLCHSIITFISSAPSKLVACDSGGCVLTWLGCLLGTAAAAELISKVLRSSMDLLRSPSVRQFFISAVKDGVSQKTYKMKWKDYCDWAYFCPAMSYMLPRTGKKWPNSRLGVSSIAPAFQDGQPQTGAVSVLGPDCDEDGLPYRRISRVFVALHLGLFFLLAYVASSTMVWLLRVSFRTFFYVLATLGLNSTFDNVFRIYTDHVSAMVILSGVLVLTGSLLKNHPRAHPNVQRLGNFLTWRYVQVNAIFCLCAMFIHTSSRGTRQEFTTYTSSSSPRSDWWMQRTIRKYFVSGFQFIGRNMFTGLMFMGVVQAYYTKCKFELETRLLRKSASALSNELRCSAESRLNAEKEFQQLEIKLRSDLLARDAELASLKAKLDAQLNDLLAKLAQFEDDNNRLLVENGRLDMSFEDRVQTEVEDRDLCISGLKDKCERMRRELEEAERTLSLNASERAERETALLELKSQQDADVKRMNAVIQGLNTTLEELQANRAAEKEAWEKEREESRARYEAVEVKQIETAEELRLATERFAEEKTTYRTQAQRLINDLNNEIRLANSQRKDADMALKAIKDELYAVRNDLRSTRLAKEALERRVGQWEHEVKTLDAMWKEVGLVSGKWEAARGRFSQLAAQTGVVNNAVKEDEAEISTMNAVELPAVHVQSQDEVSTGISGEFSVYQIPAKRTPLFVSGSPVDIWPVHEDQIPSWIPFPNDLPSMAPSVPTHSRHSSIGGRANNQISLGRSTSTERLARGTNGSFAVKDKVAKPAVRSGSGLRMFLGNASSVELSSSEFGGRLSPKSISVSSKPSPVPSEAGSITSVPPRGSLFESMHAPKRILTPVVSETVASGGLTQTSGVFNVTLAATSNQHSGSV